MQYDFQQAVPTVTMGMINWSASDSMSGCANQDCFWFTASMQLFRPLRRHYPVAKIRIFVR